MGTAAEQIKATCEAEWDRWKSDCSGFVRAVARQYGYSLVCPANLMIDQLARNALWEDLGKNGKTAMKCARAGQLVIGGLKSPGHGHVVVVVDAGVHTIPVAYWGRFGGVGRKNTEINFSWQRKDLGDVRYFAADI